MTASIAITGILLTALIGGAEPFAPFFQRAQEDHAFLLSRTSPELVVTEELSWGDTGPTETRRLTCSVAQIELAGWNLVPSPEQRAKTGVSYSEPKSTPGGLVVSLGPPEGEADAELAFQLKDNAWSLVRVVVFTRLSESQPAPVSPCDSPGT